MESLMDWNIMIDHILSGSYKRFWLFRWNGALAMLAHTLMESETE